MSLKMQHHSGTRSLGILRYWKGGKWHDHVRFTKDLTVHFQERKHANSPYAFGGVEFHTQSIFHNQVGIGTSSPNEKLTVAGNVLAEGVIVKPKDQWADCVFEEDYDLPTLEEVSRFIDEQGHLPDVPSAEAVKESGLRLGEMDATLLRKVEELTLYAIGQKERADSLAARTDRQSRFIEQLGQENDQLRQRLDAQKRQINRLREAVQKYLAQE